MKNKSTIPPKAFLKFFRWFCHPKLRNSIEGDLMELYQERLKEIGKRKADVKFIIDVLLLFRPSIIKPMEGYKNLNNYGMLKNYFKIGWRSLAKQKMYSSIKIGGFALGIAACILIALFIKDELSYDTQYPNGNRIYRIISAYSYKGESGKDVFWQAPFANSLREDYPEIEKIGRYNSSELFGAGSNQIKRANQSENTYEEGFVYVDQALLEMLDVPMVYGSLAHCLDEPNTLVITKNKADKYFPNENPVGKLMVINNDEKNAFKIGGVIQDFPSTSHFQQFDFFITLKNKEFWPGELSYWGATNYPTYVMLRPGTSVAQFEKKLMKVVEKYLLPFWIKDGVADANVLAKSCWFELQPIKDIHLRSEGISDGQSHGDIRFVWLFGAVAGFILLIACINFINLSTAKSANRAKEVGLRKTVGSVRSQIMNQFLAESLVFSFLSFGVGLVLAGLLLPYFNLLAAKSLIFPWQDWRLYPMTIIAAIAIGLLAGIYPAFYLSAFKPVDVLKGKVSNGKNSTTRSSLVVFQFTTSIILIIATFVIYQQVQYILNKKVGFDKDQVVLIQGTNTLDKQIKTFKNELLQLSQVKGATISGYLPIKGTKRNGNGFWKEGRNKIDKSVGGQMWVVDPDYLQTMGIKLIDGRNFSERMPTDTMSLIINQSMAKELELSNPVGQRIMNWEVYNVIGVVEDFHFESLRDKIEPLAFRLGASPDIVSVKVNAGEMSTVLGEIDKVWRKFSPHQPIRFAFLDESFARMYDDVQRMGRIFVSAAVLAIIVACLGLFALSAFMVEQRSKEISIRLVLGASLKSIFSLLTLNFLKLVLISIVIATPIAWYAMRKWLEDFTYRTEITWDVFLLAGIMAVLIAVLTISYQSIRAALMNPVKSLKSE